jgi:apolipoprotein N-acyltransferase
VLTALALGPFRLGGLVFVSLVPFFAFLDGKSARSRCAWGMPWGGAVHLAALVWLRHVTWAGWAALAFYHAVYTALFALGWGFFKTPFCLAWFWAVLEWTRENLMGGSPFGSLAASLAPWPVAIQVASLGGITLVGFWIVWTNASILHSIRFPGNPARFWALLVFVLPLGFGMFRLNSAPPQAGPAESAFTAGIVQPNIPMHLKWDPARGDRASLDVLEEQSLRFAPGSLDLLVWPETVITVDFRMFSSLEKRIANIAKRLECSVLLGAPDMHAPEKGDYNGAFWVDPAGSVNAVYHKVNLVPFGEYAPLARWLPFTRLLTPIREGYRPGGGAVRFRLNGYRFAPLICFEDTLSLFVRRVAAQRVDFLVTITNDGWFPGRFGPLAHDRLARFRAVENAVSLVRCANTGVSSWIDPLGRTLGRVTGEDGRAVGVRGTLKCRIPPRREGATPFQKGGYAWIAVLGAWVLFRLWPRRRSKRP